MQISPISEVATLKTTKMYFEREITDFHEKDDKSVIVTLSKST